MGWMGWDGGTEGDKRAGRRHETFATYKEMRTYVFNQGCTCTQSTAVNKHSHIDAHMQTRLE